MTEELESRLRERLRTLALPYAPDALHEIVDGLPMSAERRRSQSPFRALAVAAVLVVGGAVAVMVGGREPRLPAPSMPPPGPTATEGANFATATALPSPSPSDERPYTVSELLEARDAGALEGASVTVAGYWSEGVPHSCPAPRGDPGDLEIYCHDGEFGIAERPELVMEFRDGFSIPAEGPWLTPYVDILPSRYIVTPSLPGRQFPPIPIVVRGHVDDPRAAECRPEAAALCRDRFVIDQVLEFEPRLLEPPTPRPDATAFPSPPPAAAFGPEGCFLDASQVASAGWTTAEDIGIRLRYTGRIYALVSEHLPLTVWLPDPATGDEYQIWAQIACYREDFYLGTDVSTVFVKPVGGTIYWEYEDGHRVQRPGP